MAKERLSKLQKYILRNCYFVKDGKEITGMRKVDIFRYFKSTYFLGSQEFLIRKNFKAFMPHKEYNKVNATISRSIRGLRDKGYIKLIGHEKQQVPNFEYLDKAGIGNLTKEDYLEKHKNQSLEELIRDFGKWFKMQDVVIEIKNNNTNKTKILELTDKGIKKAKEFLKLSSVN
ncbi:hypothetical protein ES705_49413 [subsurface metagenome]